MNKKKLVTGGVVLSASYIATINTIINSYFKRSKIGIDELSFIEDELIREDERKRKVIYKNWFIDSNKTELNITSYDGLKLHGYIINNLNTNKYIIFSHGLNGNLESSLSLAYNFQKYGFNSLIYDQRCCGESDGDYCTMGLKESTDLIKWINTLIDIYPDASICLHGTSMGSSSVCMSLQNALPNNVKCVIADCGFSCLKDEIEYLISNQYHLPVLPLSTSINLMLKKKFKFSFSDISPVKSLRNNKLPICFVHGTSDNFVPFEMANTLYQANINGTRKYYPVENKGHGQAKLDENYYINLDKFIKEYI